MGKLVMGYWDCPSCGSKGLRGDQASCPNCGRARGEVKFYMKNHAEGSTLEAHERADIEYVDEEKAKYINRNPDWYCSFCQSLNSDNAQFCASCGASRASSEANYFQMHEAQKAREEARNEPAPAKAAPKKRSLLPLILIAVVILGVMFFLNSSKTSGDFQVAQLSWERAIAIEQNLLFHESGWSVPSGGEVTGQRREIHHYNSVLDHYEDVEVQRSRQVLDHYETYYTYSDKGNGYYEEVAHERPVYTTEYYTETESRPVYRQVPEYATKYDYDIWRWTPTRTATSSGVGQEAYWPETNLAEDEREGDRAEVYRAAITNLKKNTTTTYRMEEADWLNLREGDNLYITSKRTGAGAYISDEKGERLMDLYPDR